MRIRTRLLALAAGLSWPVLASAHASEQVFVLLLPTAGYIASGVAVVALTVLAVFVLPDRLARALFAWRPVPERGFASAPRVTSLLSLAVLAGMVWIGVNGPRDPMENLMSLGFWTVWWIAVIPAACVVGNLWGWINPWTGLLRLAGIRARLTLPDWLGVWPATAGMIAFGVFLLADIAPADPARLAVIAGTYWVLMLAGGALFGARWFEQAEFGAAILRAYGSLAPLRLGAHGGIGVPGWQLAEAPPLRGAGAFVLVLLAIGSFDGLNETFWWLGRIGINPLEFPGRSAVVAQNILGLFAALVTLFAVFAAVVWLGLAMSRAGTGFAEAFNRLALSLTPIALAYHLGHYLTSFLVDIQYSVLALNDPMERGANLLGLDGFQVTTGFFKRIDSVRAIWLSQAVIIVLGHVWSVLLGHRIALGLVPGGRKALLATLPLSLLMIAYTFLGLWLLATPRGA